MTTLPSRWMALALLPGALVASPAAARQAGDVPPFDRKAAPGDPPPVPGAENAPGKEPEVLGRGPLHQGFAQPPDSTPRRSPVVPKAPPAPIQEVPPEQKPAGDDVVWVPGYWAWDDDRNDFLWVSGFWRVPPPGRKWVPGSWVKVAGGWQFVSGYWGEVGQPAPLLDAPPESLDIGPNVPPLDDSYFWSPGSWVPRDNRWLWRPGYWCPPRPGWIYTPPCYCWTPRGCLFVRGFWDRCLLTRGVPFAPVYFPPGLRATPGFRFTPGFALGIGGVLGSFWARPGWGHYAFGDYYGSRYARAGYQPWHSFGPRARDPLFSYYRNAYARTNPNWARGLASTYDGRLKGTLPRPPRAFTAQSLRSGGVTSPVVQPLANYRNAALPLVRATAADRAPVERTLRSFGSLGADLGRLSTPGTIRSFPREVPSLRDAPSRPGVLNSRPGLTRPPYSGSSPGALSTLRPPRELPRSPLPAPRYRPPAPAPRYTPPIGMRSTPPPRPYYGGAAPRFSPSPGFRGGPAHHGSVGGGRGRGR